MHRRVGAFNSPKPVRYLAGLWTVIIRRMVKALSCQYKLSAVTIGTTCSLNGSNVSTFGDLKGPVPSREEESRKMAVDERPYEREGAKKPQAARLPTHVSCLPRYPIIHSYINYSVH